MKRKIRQKSLILIIVLILPVIGYGVFEVNSLISDERELKTIYERQLDAVLFSLDQYAQDIVTSLATKVEANYVHDSTFSSLPWLFETNNYIKAFYVTNPSHSQEHYAIQQPVSSEDSLKRLIEHSYQLIRPAERRLLDFYTGSANYRKIETLNEPFLFEGRDYYLITFVISNFDETRICTLAIDAESFIQQIIGPRIQAVSQGEFIINSKRIDSEFDITHTSPEDSTLIERSEPIDLMPQHEIGIARVGSTIEESVNKRRRLNNWSLRLLILFLSIGVFLIYRNIRREMELAQNKAEFVSNVSHEIRTPLALINMFAETLLLDRVKEERKKKEYYEIITKEVGRLTNMINRILSFSKIEAGKRVYNLHPISLNALAEDVLNTYSYHLESKGFTYSFEKSSEELQVQADREALVEVIVNLVDNAMKYSTDRKEITIRTQDGLEFVSLEIEDKGMGIPKNQLEKLFEKFYRVPTGDVHDTKGSGLGLTIVKHIMDAHEGKIDIQSEVGKGSTFKLLFPKQS